MSQTLYWLISFVNRHMVPAADSERKEKVFQYELVGVNSLITGSVSRIA